jgi:hypothetical protein
MKVVDVENVETLYAIAKMNINKKTFGLIAKKS